MSQEEQYIRPGMIKASATIAPSKMLNRDIQNIYLNGFLAYQLDEHLSLRGESFFLIKDALNKDLDNSYNGAMCTYFGAFYHSTKGNWDSFFGFQPGLAVVQMKDYSGATFNPSFALKLGTSYYVWKYFHFFVDLTYTNTTVRRAQANSVRTDELILSAGLGFQINTRK